MWTKLVVVTVVSAVACLGAAAGGSAGQKTGCQVGQGWQEMTVVDVAEEVFDNLLPGVYPWGTEDEFADFISATLDKNGDGSICLKMMWGDNLNPKSHWYLVGIDLGFGTGVTQYLPHDNNANASNKA